MTPDPISILPLGERQRVKRGPVWGPKPPKEHRCCPMHPERYVRAERGAHLQCWLCEPKDEAVFAELDELIALQITHPRERVTPEIIEAARMRR